MTQPSARPDAATPGISTICVSAWDAARFRNGLTLAASLHRHAPGLQLFVYDLGLTAAQIALIGRLRPVTLLPRPAPGPGAPGLAGCERTQLLAAMLDAALPGTSALWIDPDTALCADPAPLFDTIARDGALMIGLDLHRQLIPDASGPQINPALFGMRAGTPAARALRFGIGRAMRDASLLSQIAQTLGLAPDASGRLCSTISEDTLLTPAGRDKLVETPRRPLRLSELRVGSAAFQHLGIVTDYANLAYRHASTPVCAVLGEELPLPEADADALETIDRIGIDDGIAGWHRDGRYPTVYACLDPELGMELKEQILDLLRNRARYGIRLLLLRQTLVDWLAERAPLDGVVTYDLVMGGDDLLRSPPITTASHAFAWAATAGYGRLLVAGVDCPAGADDMLSLWHHMRDRLSREVLVANVSLASRIDAFPRLPLDRALALMSLDQMTSSAPLQPFLDVLAKQAAQTPQKQSA